MISSISHHWLAVKVGIEINSSVFAVSFPFFRVSFWFLFSITFTCCLGEATETVKDFIYMGSKIIADGECSHEIKRHLLLGREAMTNLDSILKSKDEDYTFRDHFYSSLLEKFLWLCRAPETMRKRCSVLSWMLNRSLVLLLQLPLAIDDRSSLPLEE